jgi:redox-sensitive bicupin YhaK (pirin superfamily)
MDYLRRAGDRGQADFGWLQSRHSFSFGNYYDPAHMGLSVLRVINDDQVAGGAGFDTHGHRDMEIISYVLDGAIKHADSMGNEFVVRAGEVQRMSAGTGVYHSEFNRSPDAELRFLQIWVVPNKKGIAPGYEQKAIEQTSKLTPLVTSDGRDGSLTMHQDANLYRLRLRSGESYRLTNGKRAGYLHIVKGSAQVGDLQLQAGDAVGFIRPQEADVIASENNFEALWFDLPPHRI